MHTKAVAEVPRAREEGFSCFLLLFSKAVPEDFNMKFRSKFNHGFTNRGCFHCATLSLQGKRCNFSFEMFGMKLSRF